MRQAEEETASIKIAGAGGVDDLRDPGCLDYMGMVGGHDNRAPLAAGQRGDVAIPAHQPHRLVEILGLVERADLRLVGEEDVDMVADEVAELGAMAADAKRVAEAEADPPPGGMGELRRLAEGLLGARRVEAIALEVGNLGGCDDPVGD